MSTYCELPIIDTWFEPLNTISNLAFIIAAVLIWRLARRAGEAKLRRQLTTLSLITLAIGVGSSAWHFFRTDWAAVMDVLPIQIFLMTFAWLFGKKVWPGKYSGLATVAGLLIATAATPFIFTLINIEFGAGGAGYSGPLLFAVILSFLLWHSSHRLGKYFFITLLVFTVSLTLRQIDAPLCNHLFGVGTHILWHLLNAVVLYRFARILML